MFNLIKRFSESSLFKTNRLIWREVYKPPESRGKKPKKPQESLKELHEEIDETAEIQGAVLDFIDRVIKSDPDLFSEFSLDKKRYKPTDAEFKMEKVEVLSRYDKKQKDAFLSEAMKVAGRHPLKGFKLGAFSKDHLEMKMESIGYVVDVSGKLFNADVGRAIQREIRFLMDPKKKIIGFMVKRLR